MFEAEKARYMTMVVAEELSLEHKQVILNYIHNHKAQLTDYLQVFEFYIENDQQWLIQCQEQPERKTTIFVPLINSWPIERKVWVMDEGDHVMLLFPEDY